VKPNLAFWFKYTFLVSKTVHLIFAFPKLTISLWPAMWLFLKIFLNLDLYLTITFIYFYISNAKKHQSIKFILLFSKIDSTFKKACWSSKTVGKWRIDKCCIMMIRNSWFGVPAFKFLAELFLWFKKSGII